MDAVDYYNRGLKKMREKDFEGAEGDFFRAISGDTSIETDKVDLEIMANLNHGIACWNQVIGMDKYSNKTIRLTTSAILNFEKVLELDSDPERRAKAKELIEMVQNGRGY